MEQAKGFAALMDLNSWTGKQVANSLNLSPSTVSRALALLDLPEEIQKRVADGELGARAAYEIGKLDDAEVQRSVANTHDPTTRKIAASVRKRRGRKSPEARGFNQTFFAEDGIKVRVSSPKKVNYHEVELALTQALDEVRHYLKNGKF